MFHTRSLKTITPLALAGLLLSGACDRPNPIVRTGGAETPQYRTGWLGSAEGWGLLGLPLRSGLATYRSARNLDSPAWAPPELGPVTAARPAPGAVWLRFETGELGRLDYSTGRLRTYGDLAEGARLSIPMPGTSALLIATDSLVSLVGEGAPWRFALPGRLVLLDRAGDDRVLALVEAASGAEALVLRPPEREPLGRADLEGVADAAVTAWGQRLYYIPAAPGDSVVAGLSIPELRPIGELALPRGAVADALAATPSGHRLYVASASNLFVFDRLAGRLLRTVELPAPVRELRFGATGSTLLGRVDGEERIVVLQVGVDSILGVVPGSWDEHVPAALPGGRLITRPDSELVLYTIPDLLQIARVQEGTADYLWVPVEWHPPRPRTDLVRRSPSAADRADRTGDEPAPRGPAVEPAALDTTGPPAPGYYAVVLAARVPTGIDSLVAWLRSVGYRATRERHFDPTGVEWYRAMVGPYSSRPLAESAARNLSSRYGYKPWILTISGSEPDAEPIGQTTESPTADPSGAAGAGDAGAGNAGAGVDESGVESEVESGGAGSGGAESGGARPHTGDPQSDGSEPGRDAPAGSSEEDDSGRR